MLHLNFIKGNSKKKGFHFETLFFILNINMKKQLLRPICKVCNERLGAYNYKDKTTGIIRFRSTCTPCSPKSKVGYRRYKKGICEQCGFVPEHSCQLDIDHIDGNHSNNELSNLQTLCANCHRLKTYLNRDFFTNVEPFFVS